MRRIPQTPRPARAGFTLIELLVVIAIIAVLIGLTGAAVMRARTKGDEVKNRSRISQMSSAVQSFTSKTGKDFIPSRILLRNDGNYNLANAFELASLQYLKSLWPRLQFPVYNTGVPVTDPAFSLGWCPDDPAAALGSAYMLEGDQCVVFFLGGMQRNRACMGFANNTSNPTLVNATASPPYMDFPTADLWPKFSDPLPPPSPTRAQYFMSYLDPYGLPYAYFSSRSFSPAVAPFNVPPFTLPGYNPNDCAGLAVISMMLTQTSTQPGPCFEPSGKFYNRDGFQIFSAGSKKLYGPGALSGLPWDSGTGMPYSPGFPGYDNMSNFHQRIMGAGSN